MTDKLELFHLPSAFSQSRSVCAFSCTRKASPIGSMRTIYDMSPVGEQRGWKHLKMNQWGETPTSGARGRFLPEQRPPPSRATSMTPSRAARSWARRLMSAASTRCGTTGCGCTSCLSHRHGLPCAAPRPRAEAGTDQQSGVGRAFPQGGAGSRRACRSPSGRWPRVVAGRGTTNLLGYHDGDRDRLLEISGERHPRLDERFEHIDAFWQRWQRRPAFLAAYADRNSGVPELDNRS